MQLHWLPVRSRVQFKLCTLMHAIYNQRSPSYLSDTVQTVCDCNYSLRSLIICHYGLCRAAYTFQVRWALSGPSRMQDLLPGTAFQITFVASPHLQPSEDIWKRCYSLKFLTLPVPRTFNIVMSAGHLCKCTQNRRWWWWWCQSMAKCLLLDLVV